MSLKCFSIKVNPENFEDSMQKTVDLLGKNGDKEISLIFSGGNYKMNTPVNLNANDFPGKCSLRFLAASKRRPVFNSLVPISASSFVKVKGKPYYVYQLEAQENGEFPKLRTLYVDGKIAEITKTKVYTSSRRFSMETAPFTKYNGCPKQYNTDHKMYIPIEIIDEVGLEDVIGAELHVRVEWEFKINHIAKIDVNDSYTNEEGKTFIAVYTAENEKDACDGLSRCNRPCFVCGIPSTLRPGQYAYNTNSGQLYYYPEKDILDCDISCGTLTNLFEFAGFNIISLCGLDFTGVEDQIFTEMGYFGAMQAGWWDSVCEHGFPQTGVVKVLNAGEFIVDDCTFKNLPCDGISMIGNLSNISICNSRFANIGATAIRIGKPFRDGIPKQIDLSNDGHGYIKNLSIVNNYIKNTGFTYNSSCAVLITKAENARINHNTILDSSYTALSIGWKWDVADWEFGEKVNLENVEIAYNYVKGFMLNMVDGGGIYTLGGNAKPSHTAFMNTVHDNYIIEDENTCPDNEFFASLYHDGASSNWYDSNNVIVHNPERYGITWGNARIYLQRGMHPDYEPGTASTLGQSSWNILCENNFVCCCKDYGEVFFSRDVDPERATDILDISRNLRETKTYMLKSTKELKKFPVAAYVIKNAGCEKAICKKV